MRKFRDIPQFTMRPGYAVDVSWNFLPTHYVSYVLQGLDVDPDFQRGYVWTEEQRVRYVEFILRGGMTGRDIYCNCPWWSRGGTEDFVLVDGKQRLDAVLGFLGHEFPVFDGAYRRDYADAPDTLNASFRWHVNDLKTRGDVLQWYLDLNAGGTVHTDAELDRVRLLQGEPAPAPLAPAERRAHGRLDRAALVSALARAEGDETRATTKRAASQAAEIVGPKGHR